MCWGRKGENMASIVARLLCTDIRTISVRSVRNAIQATFTCSSTTDLVCQLSPCSFVVPVSAFPMTPWYPATSKLKIATTGVNTYLSRHALLPERQLDPVKTTRWPTDSRLQLAAVLASIDSARRPRVREKGLLHQTKGRLTY